MHMVVWLDFDNMGMTVEEYIDQYITAEIPDSPPVGDNSVAAKLQRKYRRFILDNMYHTCSPNYCLVDGRCLKRFPVQFRLKCVIFCFI